nr:YbjN domain-containing protein [Hyphomonas sp. Mor2]
MRHALYCFALAPLLATASHADETRLVDAFDPKRIVSILQDEGYRSKLSVDEDGKVSIMSGAHGTDFHVYFEACSDGGTKCEILAFRAGFDFDRPPAPAILDEWNLKRWTKSFRDEDGDPFLEYAVNMVHGVSEANFRDTLNWYVRELGEFIDEIGWNDTESQDVEFPPSQPI